MDAKQAPLIAMETLSDSSDSEYACGVAISMKLGKIAHRRGVTIELPVEDIERMVAEEVGNEEASKTIVTFDNLIDSHGAYKSLGEKERAKKGLEKTDIKHVIQLNLGRGVLRGNSKNVSHSLRHELSHERYSIEIGHDEGKRRARLRAYLVGIPASMATYWSGLAMGKGEMVSLDEAVYIDALSAIAAISASFLATYFTDPDEIRARKHVRRLRLSTEPIIVHASKSKNE